MRKIQKIFALILTLLLFLSACSPAPQPTAAVRETDSPASTKQSIPSETPTPTPPPPRLLTVCMGQEPTSLFLYGDDSQSARSIRQAIYDGPLDIHDFEATPVILERLPSLENGDATLEPVSVASGDLIVDAQGNLARLEQDVHYLPSGCREAGCAQSYTGEGEVELDQLEVRFHLMEGVTWSDGTPISAEDSEFSYQVARNLFPAVEGDLLNRTQSYAAIDDRTVQWTAIPGFFDPAYQTNFFTPLPKHVLGMIPPAELAQNELAARRPLGWGPFVLQDWVPGDHISLRRNPLYFRAAEGLPYLDQLVFRFVETPQAAVEALLAGECDLVDETVSLGDVEQQALDLEAQGKLKVLREEGTAWEQISFGVQPWSPPQEGATPPVPPSAPFSNQETRQAIAQCIDRRGIAREASVEDALLAESYVPPSQPYYNTDVPQPTYDPQAGAAQLEAAGWVDSDGDPATPRLAQGVAGVANGTPLQVTYLTSDLPLKRRQAEVAAQSLEECGVQVEIQALPWEDLMAPGPDGPVFGRHFDLAQFAWRTALRPPCSLYTSQEIPGPYPEFPKGWGGGNVTGFSSQEFDRLCNQANNTLPDEPGYAQAQLAAQALFSEALPALPLYLHDQLLAMRPDMCGVTVDPSAPSTLQDLEQFDYGEACSP